ncbi:hypothetical protein [Catenulispora yoronensis]|uniref:hypothetical protein n=1 Tax=Catenulispora yoronensis TaxID=450799 RepID=UPI0031D7AFD2
MTGERERDRGGAYARAARLIYLTEYGSGARAALVTAHRLAARAVRETDAAAVTSTAADTDSTAATDSTVATAATAVTDGTAGAAPDPVPAPDPVAAAARLVLADPGDPWRHWGRLGADIRPAEPTPEQRDVLARLDVLKRPRRVAVLRHLLEGTPLPATAPTPAEVEQARTGLDLVCDDRPETEIRALLLGPELDPTRVPVVAADAIVRRRRRGRRRWAALAVLVLAAGAGVWWYGVRTPPLGAAADDPVVKGAPTANDVGLNAWTARGELLGDAALLRRAARAWHQADRPALPAGHKPAVLFAGRVRGITVVVMDDHGIPWTGYEGMDVAVYLEGVKGKNLGLPFPFDADHLVTVNSGGGDPAAAGGIRLFGSGVFGVDPILLPPGASEVRTGPLDGAAASWAPARPDARGVLEVPVPRADPQHADTGQWSPSGGIRYTLPDGFVTLTDGGPVTVQETFYDRAPLLPIIKSLRQSGSAGVSGGGAALSAGELSAGDWCAARKQAEFRTEGDSQAEWIELADVATGPLPGGGVGYLIRRTVRAWDTGQDYTDSALLAMPDGTCASADMPAAGAVSAFVDRRRYSADADLSDNAFMTVPAVAAAVWDAPDHQSYLVVAGGPQVARLKVVGPVAGQAEGRWLVIPLPQGYGPEAAELNSVEAFDAAGHMCGVEQASAPNGKSYC